MYFNNFYFLIDNMLLAVICLMRNRIIQGGAEYETAGIFHRRFVFLVLHPPPVNGAG